MTLRISYLSDFPEHIPQVAQWHKEHWGQNYPERSLEDWIKQLYLNKNKLPVTLIAWEEINEKPQLVGTVSLRVGGISLGDETTIWLSGVYVSPSARNRGIALASIKHAIKLCETLSTREKPIEKIMLFTRTSGQLYKKLGWEIMDTPYYQGGKVLLMSRKIALCKEQKHDPSSIHIII